MSTPDGTPPEVILGGIVAVIISASGLFLILDRAAPIVAQPSPVPAVAKPAVPAPVAAAPDVPPSATATAAAPGTVYRCTFNGRTTYSDTPCPGAKLVDVSPASQGFVATRPVRTAARAEVETPVPGASSTESEKASRDARCAWIENAIESIDAQARQAQSAPMQDRLREDRQKLVGERYALKC